MRDSAAVRRAVIDKIRTRGHWKGFASDIRHATVFLLQMVEQVELHRHETAAKGTRVQ